MNVLLLVPEYAPDPGGIATSAARLAEGLADRGLEVTVVTKVSDPRARLALEVAIEPCSRLALLRFARGSFYPEHWGRELGDLQERLGGRVPDIVHAMGSLRFGQIALVVGRRFGAPVVYGLRGSDLNIAALQNPGRFECVMRGANAVTAVSSALAERARSRTSRAVTVIPNAVAPADSRPREHLRHEIGFPTDWRLIGACYSRRWTKGPERLARILAGVSQRYAGAAGLCVFGVDDGGALANAWQPQRDDSRRTFRHLGNVGSKQVVDILGALDLLVIGSAYEGMPNVLLQALSAGTPVAATPAGGCRDVLEDSSAGILLAWDESTAAQAIADLLASQELVAMRERARRCAGRYSPEREIGAVQELYRSLLSSPRDTGDAARV